MVEDVIIEPMGEEFLVWRCLHGGPLCRDTIDRWPADDGMAWERYRQRNVPLLTKLTKTYGACAIVARDGEKIVGTLRFYPKAVWDLHDPDGLNGFCLQQDAPAGPGDDFAETDFPPLAQIEDKTLKVHCLMTGCPKFNENPYQRQGIGTRMVRNLIEWARSQGWQDIEADAFEDLPIIYEITGAAGRAFWEKLAFRVTDRYPHPHLQEENPFVQTLREQAQAAGIAPEKATDRIVMRLDLN